jgi:hypothetical protein
MRGYATVPALIRGLRWQSMLALCLCGLSAWTFGAAVFRVLQDVAEGFTHIASSLVKWPRRAREIGRNKAKPNIVTHFNLEITTLCNQKCVYCFNNSGPFARNEELSTEVWQQFLEHQTENGLKSVHITGGEPFVNRKAIDLINAAQKLGLRTSVLSNGYRIPELIKQFEAQFRKLSVVQISLDSAGADNHDSRRGKIGAWRQALAAIRALRRANVACEISCTVSRENLGDLWRLARFCHRLSLKLIVRPIVAVGRGTVTSLEPVDEGSLRKVLADIQRCNPGTIVCDKFWYVPDNASFDSNAREKGIVTILSDGKFRAGRIFFPQIKREFASVPEVLAVARAAI